MAEQKLRKYLGASNGVALGLGLFMAIFGLGLLLGMISSGEATVLAVIMGLFITAMGGVVVWSAVTTFRDLKLQMQTMGASGELERVLREFDQAEVLVKGNIRLGQTYVFGKGAGKVLRYGEIRQVYQYVKKENFAESVRMLKYVDQQGKTADLCKLQLRGKSDEDLKRIVTVIWQKNPGVKIGYQ